MIDANKMRARREQAPVKIHKHSMQNENKSRAILTAPNHVWAIVPQYMAIPFNQDSGGWGYGAGALILPMGPFTPDNEPLAYSLASNQTPVGALLSEIQGQLTLSMAQGMARKLKRSMAVKGKPMSDATVNDAIGAGVLAVMQWRNGQTAIDGAESGQAGVCWRAILASVADDSLGDSVEQWRQPDATDDLDLWDSLTGSALPLPQLTGDNDRTDKATRLLFERTRATRLPRLAKRIDAIKAKGGRGKRAEMIDRVHRAMVLMLNGVSLDDSATQAGFKAGKGAKGIVRAGDRLTQAIKRLGCFGQLNARLDGGQMIASGFRFLGWRQVKDNAPTAPTAPSKTARELSMRKRVAPTIDRTIKLSKGNGPIPTIAKAPTDKTYRAMGQTLDPISSAYVGRMAAAKHPRIPTMIYAQLALGKASSNDLNRYRIDGAGDNSASIVRYTHKGQKITRDQAVAIIQSHIDSQTLIASVWP